MLTVMLEKIHCLTELGYSIIGIWRALKVAITSLAWMAQEAKLTPKSLDQRPMYTHSKKADHLSFLVKHTGLPFSSLCRTTLFFVSLAFRKD